MYESVVKNKNQEPSGRERFVQSKFSQTEANVTGQAAMTQPYGFMSQKSEKPLQMQPMTRGVLQMNPVAEGRNDVQMKCKACANEEILQSKTEPNNRNVSENVSKGIQKTGLTDSKLSSDANQIRNNSIYADSESNPGKNKTVDELTKTVQQQNSGEKMVQRYSHEDCDETLDLRPHIWPADHMAKAMVNNGIAALTASPVSAATNALLDRHFNSHSASTVTSVLAVLQRIKAAFDSDEYTYECEDDCDDANAYVYGVWSDVHLCMNVLRGRDNKGIAAIIVHEFSHYYGGTDDNVYYFSFGSGTAPASLSVADAVENADSYEGFAYGS